MIYFGNTFSQSISLEKLFTGVRRISCNFWYDGVYWNEKRLIRVVLVDFERSARNALNQNLGLDLKGRFIHLCSNVRKHIPNLGLQLRYIADDEFALHMQMIGGFGGARVQIRNHYEAAETEDMIEYLEDNDIDRFDVEYVS